jgi:4-amino-4-deoxy-L-arabinose transferase-like glycosyltransferase
VTLSDRLAYILLSVIVVLFVVVGVLYAVFTPPWQTPDEPAHYNYVAQLAGGGCCPVIAPGDWDMAYLEALRANGFPEDADLSAIEYEDHQPPLYYLLAWPVYAFGGGSLIALRVLSVTFGAGVVVAAYFVVARLLPHRRVLALAAATFVAFVPQHTAMMAAANNDGLAELVLGVVLVVALTYLGNPIAGEEGGRQPLDESCRPHVAALGGLAGVAFLTKLTIYFPVAAVIGVAILLRWRREKRPIRWLAGQVVWAAGLALIAGGVWWGRNVRVYGWPDLFGLRAHDAAVAGQLRAADHVAAIGLGPYLRDFVTVTYHSFWGQFGWMGVPMPRDTYLLIGLFSLWIAAGLVMLAARPGAKPRLEPVQWAGAWVLLAATLATVANYVYYNLGFVQFQGRYLFTALIPFGALAALGGRGWASMPGRWLRGERWACLLEWLPLAAVGWLPLLALWALFRCVVPNLG